MKFSLEDSGRDLEDQHILIGAGITFLIVFSFTIYRLVNGDFFLGFIDSILSVVFVAIFLEYWRSNKIKNFNLIVVISYSVSVLAVIYLRMTQMIFWAYPVIVATYYLLKSRHAIVINGLFISFAFAFGLLLSDTPAVGVYPSLILVFIFGYLFSRRSEDQNKKLQHLVSEDELTRVKNRRSFNEKVEEILADIQRHPKPICLLLLDIDYFKKINDSYGHKKGDKILYDFAQTVKSLIRNTDHIYRFGGEEFVIVANHSSLQDAGVFANKIRKAIETKFSLVKYDVTVSIGVSEIHPSDDADSCFRRADLALYESKSKGRNRVHTAEFVVDGVTSIKKSKGKIALKIHPVPTIKTSKQDQNFDYNDLISFEQIVVNSSKTEEKTPEH